MAKPLLSSLLPSQSHPHPSNPSAFCPSRVQAPSNTLPQNRRPQGRPAARPRARPPSAALLAVLAALVAEHLTATSATSAFPAATTAVTLPPEPERGFKSKGPAFGCPDIPVPDFLCPALAGHSVSPAPTQALPRQSVAVASDSSAFWYQERQRLPEQRDDVIASGSGSGTTTTENSYLDQDHRSSTTHTRFFITASPFFSTLSTSTSTPTHTHDDRPADSQFVLEDVVHDELSVVSRQSTSGQRPESNFSLAQGDETKRKKTKSSRTKRKLRRDDSSSSSTECSELYTSRTIPDRYELGNDGRWHKLSVSSSCSLCECASQVDEIDDAAANDISPSGVTNTDTSYEADGHSSNTATASSSSIPPSKDSNGGDALSIILPDGWDRTSDSVVYRVPLIVVASLLLAAAVTGAVWFTFFWRGRQRIRGQLALASDLEKRKKAEGEESGNEGESVHEDDDGDDGAEGRGEGRRGRRGRRGEVDRARREKTDEEKEKARARATAKWKAHMRWFHRRRHGRAGLVEGGVRTQTQRQAMASGVSLDRSSWTSTSMQSSASDRAGGTEGSGARSADVRSRLQSTVSRRSSVEMASGSTGGTDAEPTHIPMSSTMTGFRVRGSRDRRNGSGDVVLQDAGALSERRRPVEERDEQQSQNEQQSLDQERGRYLAFGGNSGSSNTPNLHSTSSGQGPPSASSGSASVAEQESRRDYDRPPPELSPDVHGPPAYRSRRSADDVEGRLSRRIRSRRGRRRRDEKRETGASGYVPAPEDCASYSSSGEDEDGNEQEERSSLDNRRDVQMHVAVDDKQALARLAAYASAPPIPSSPPPPPLPPHSPSSSSSPPLPPTSTVSSSSHAYAEPNAPPEPEWERFDDYNYAYASDVPSGYTHADADEGDSPGAGPGPSTVYARSISPSSRPGSPSRSSGIRSPAYSYSNPIVHPSFPAPPVPISSQLAYAPADAGFVHPHLSLDLGLGYGVGHERDDDFDLRLGLNVPPIEGPSAPPFSPYPHEGEGRAVEGMCGDVLAGASAPPLFDEENDLYVESGPSAPPADHDVDLAANSGASHAPPEEEEEELEYVETEAARNADADAPPPEPSHVETADRNAVPSAVR